MADNKKPGTDIVSLASRAVESINTMKLQGDFEEAAKKLEGVGKVGYDSLVQTYGDTPENQKRLVRLSDKFSESANRMVGTGLASFGTGAYAIYDVLATIDTHVLTNLPVVSLPIALFCGFAAYAFGKETKKVSKTVKEDLEKAEQGLPLIEAPKKQPALPAPGPTKLI